MASMLLSLLEFFWGGRDGRSRVHPMFKGGTYSEEGDSAVGGVGTLKRDPQRDEKQPGSANRTGREKSEQKGDRRRGEKLSG